VTYSSWASAEAAIEGVDNKFTLPGAANPITVKFADAKPQDIQRVGGKRGAGDMMMGGMGGGGKRQFMGQGMAYGRGGGMGGGYGMGGMVRGSREREWCERSGAAAGRLPMRLLVHGWAAAMCALLVRLLLGRTAASISVLRAATLLYVIAIVQEHNAAGVINGVADCFCATEHSI
jgi:hypothetical protein